MFDDYCNSFTAFDKASKLIQTAFEALAITEHNFILIATVIFVVLLPYISRVDSLPLHLCGLT